MYELAWARELFERWPQAMGRQPSAPFFAVLRTVDHETMLPDAGVLAAALTAAGNNPGTLELWSAWQTFLAGDPRRGFSAFRKTARQFAKSPEAAALVGAAGLLANSREVGWKAWHEARRLDPRYAFLDSILDRFGRRRGPVLPFLSRTNPINVGLGRLRSRLRRA